jgi:hypothetical protein
MNVIDYITITCNLRNVRLQITFNYGKVERGRDNLFSMDKQYIKKIINVLYIVLLQTWGNRNL